MSWVQGQPERVGRPGFYIREREREEMGALIVLNLVKEAGMKWCGVWAGVSSPSCCHAGERPQGKRRYEVPGQLITFCPGPTLQCHQPVAYASCDSRQKT
jgi:hypothetical protein